MRYALSGHRVRRSLAFTAPGQSPSAGHGEPIKSSIRLTDGSFATTSSVSPRCSSHASNTPRSATSQRTQPGYQVGPVRVAKVGIVRGDAHAGLGDSSRAPRGLSRYTKRWRVEGGCHSTYTTTSGVSSERERPRTPAARVAPAEELH